MKQTEVRGEGGDKRERLKDMSHVASVIFPVEAADRFYFEGGKEIKSDRTDCTAKSVRQAW